MTILNALWDKEPSKVRQVCDRLAEAKPTGYTTLLKLLQMMISSLSDCDN
ncbi:BlaI/MecI/CopY family transcriptional regulator [bacterium]|nr:BlaI/MecI/CopY family transcriptional regulator [bacterium]